MIRQIHIIVSAAFAAVRWAWIKTNPGPRPDLHLPGLHPRHFDNRSALSSTVTVPFSPEG
jgi:hypothetical protein